MLCNLVPCVSVYQTKTPRKGAIIKGQVNEAVDRYRKFFKVEFQGSVVLVFRSQIVLHLSFVIDFV